MLSTSFQTTDGESVTLEGETVKSIAEQMDLQTVDGGTAKVFDDRGFLRGWVRSRFEWWAS
jgi:hypothetical protein